MSLVGKYVTINDTYEGNLADVVGKTGRVIAHNDGLLALDIRAYKKDQDHRYWDYDVMVLESEVTVKEFEFKDSKGQLVEIGDKIVYGPLGGGVTVGTVVDIKEAAHSSWGRSYTETKVQVEIESSKMWYDGDRKIEVPSTTTRWYSHGGRMLIVEKSQKNYISASSIDSVRIHPARIW